jgi:hypothetical protein
MGPSLLLARDHVPSADARRAAIEHWRRIYSSRGALLPVLLSPPTSFSSRPLPAGQVSDPEADLRFSALGGVAQVNSSTAWCSPNVVTTFADGGAYLESYLAGGATTQIRYSYSKTNGARYVTGPTSLTGAGGSVAPSGSVACGDPDHFYIATVVNTAPGASVVVFASGDGGTTFPNRFVAVPEVTGHSYSLPSILADPSDSSGSTLYVAFVDFDPSDPACGGGSSVAAKASRTTDGGTTWSQAAPVDPVVQNWCNPNQHVEVSVAVSATGQLHAAIRAQLAGVSHVITTRSTDAGSTWQASASMPILTPGDSDSSFAQGGIGFSLRPTVAIDRSQRSTRGNVYVVWSAGGSLSIPNGVASGEYRFADVFLSRSTDGGVSFEPPVRVNDSIEPIDAPIPGRGTDHYQPSVAVDARGVAAVCFFDRRRDPMNFRIDRWCARSTDGGVRWTNLRKTTKSFWPMPGEDFVYVDTILGDLDTLASDFTSRMTGFRGAYTDTSRGSHDIRALSFR